MKKLASWSPAPELDVIAVERGDPDWTVVVEGRCNAVCPSCGTQSGSRHSSYRRTLRDLSALGTPVTVRAHLTRWRCRNSRCDRRTFAEQLPSLGAPYARRTARLAAIVRMFGHSAGGRSSERLLARLGMSVSDTTILWNVKVSACARPNLAPLRVVGVDEWAWRKGMTFGTVIVDLERRQVVDLLADRSAATMAAWFKRHPEIEVISRDRAGLYADAGRQGAPQARQVADRFHLLKNFRETIERQLGGFEAAIRQSPNRIDDGQDISKPPRIEKAARCSEVVAHNRLVRLGRVAARQAKFDEIRKLYEAGGTITEIARELGLGSRHIARWVRRIDVPERSAMAPKPSTPAYFGAFLARSWAEGTTKIRHLFSDIRHRGYTGSYSHLASYVAPWRGSAPSGDDSNATCTDQEAPAAAHVRTLDPSTGRPITPLTAAALCVKPRGGMTMRQLANVDALKAASVEFTTMRHLAMRFRGLLRGGTAKGLDVWLHDARTSGIYGMRRFARTLRQDIEAVRNAVSEPWSNGQTEGQINRLKTLKRAMYGRAGVGLLRARMTPLQETALHQD